MATKKMCQRRNLPDAESDHPKSARGRKVGDVRLFVDWRREFGLELFELSPSTLLAMCEEIYKIRMRYLKWEQAACAALLHTRSNEAIIAARTTLDPCPERVIDAHA